MKILWQDEADIKLLTQIRRSYWRIDKRLRDEGKVSTPLFTFRNEGKERFFRNYVRVFSVVVKSTRRKYYVTHSFSFGQHDWNLWRTG